MRISTSETEGYCLVLSGGGAKGVYHIGAARALRELGVPIAACVGNSVGAIIAAYLAQGLMERLESIARTIGFEMVIKLPDGLVKNGGIHLHTGTWEAVREFYRSALRKKGLDTSPLNDMLRADIDEQKIRARGCDLGVVTFNLTDMKPQEIFLDQMEEGTLVDYILASSAFPGFSGPHIGGKRYIDGGVYDNIPYGMARSRGYRKIIVVDISGVGVSRRADIEGTSTTYIKNSISMGGVMDFDPDFLSRYSMLGYLDTLRSFGVLRGDHYFIRPDANYEERFLLAVETEKESNPATGRGGDALTRLRAQLPAELSGVRHLLYPFLDCAASMVRLDRIREYDPPTLIREVRARMADEEARVEEIRASLTQTETERFTKRIESLTRKVRDIGAFRESPYFYHNILEVALKGSLPRLLLKNFRAFYPRVTAGIRCMQLADIMTGKGVK